MIESSTHASTENVCWACRSPLAARQVKCTECDSWQNWRRYVGFNIPVLSLIVAVIASATTLLSIIQEFTKEFDVPVRVRIKGIQNANEDIDHLRVNLGIYNYWNEVIFIDNTMSCIAPDGKTYGFRLIVGRQDIPSAGTDSNEQGRTFRSEEKLARQPGQYECEVALQDLERHRASQVLEWTYKPSTTN